MVVSRIRTLALVTALTLVTTAASAAGLQAQLGHSVVREGERVHLQLRAPAAGSMVAPDLSVLQKDFEVLGTQQSQRLQIVNGRREASIDWTVTLLPRTTGELLVPAIHAGPMSSEPLRLRVAEAGPPPSRADAPDLFVESTVDQTAPYVQGEVRYSVKVYDGIGIRGGGLTEPRAANARVTPIGEGRSYEETVNGRRYRVHEREYAITPQSSGKTVVAPVTLEARVDDPAARARSPFGDFFGGQDPSAGMLGRSGRGSSLFDQMMNPGRQVRVRSNAIEIDVQARPDGATEGWFLPAKHVELGESFEPAAPSFRVGEAVQRTVVLRALGASAEQLPAFVIPSPPGVRSYDEGSRDGTLPTEEGIVSVREQTVALVPSQAGEVVFPAVEIAWWDAQDGVERRARLPERVIEVLPALGVSGQGSVPEAASAPTRASTIADAAGHEPADPIVGSFELESLAPFGVLAALLVAAGGGLAYASRRRRTDGPIATVPDERTLVRHVQAASRANDGAAAHDALIRWARAHYGVGAPANPRMIARRLGHADFEAEAAKLDRSLYAPGADAFDGARFWQEFRAARAQLRTRRREAPAVLPELYPST